MGRNWQGGAGLLTAEWMKAVHMAAENLFHTKRIHMKVMGSLAACLFVPQTCQGSRRVKQIYRAPGMSAPLLRWHGHKLKPELEQREQIRSIFQETLCALRREGSFRMSSYGEVGRCLQEQSPRQRTGAAPRKPAALAGTGCENTSALLAATHDNSPHVTMKQGHECAFQGERASGHAPVCAPVASPLSGAACRRVV